MMRAFFVFLVSLIFTGILAGCGGGGTNGPTACSSQAALTIAISWTTISGASGVSATAADVTGTANYPMTATPNITGIPASCLGMESFAIGGGFSTGLPKGLSLNSSTGVISGTPTQVISIGGNGFVQMHLPGYSAIDVLNILTIN